MLAKVFSGAVYGVDAYEVEIEVHAGYGDPKVIIVGLPDAAVKESSERVWTALTNSGFDPRWCTTVNLAPADIRRRDPASICQSRWGCWRLETRWMAPHSAITA